MDYPILERIHYLLVAGFDVFGNLGHQLTTRLYMDFLRMEGESNFLALLPVETRQSERKLWYEGASKKQQSYVLGSRAGFDQPTGIHFKTEHHTLTVARGFIGSYPSAYWRVRSRELPELARLVSELTDEASYQALMDRYGVRRTAANFWNHSDRIMSAHQRTDPLNNALLDYSRLENR